MRSLPEALLASAARGPERLFCRFERAEQRWGELLERVRRAAGLLASRGVRRGDRIALYLPNRPAFVEAYLGALFLGGVAVPMNTGYRESELTHLVRDAEPALIVTDGAGAGELAGIAGDRLLVLGEEPAAWDAPPQPAPAPLGGDDLALLGYTSGTTGRSKGAMLTHGNFLANSAAVTGAWGWTGGDHLLLALPLFHMHGLGVGLHGTLTQGSSLTLRARFDAADVAATLADGRSTLFFGVPTMYHRLLAELRGGAPRPAGVRLFVSGSAPLPAETLLAFEALTGARILERYGMTETAMNTGNPLRGERKPGSVGLPFDGVALRLAHPKSGAAVAGGEVGEVQLRGPNVFAGYWRNAEATREAFTPDGWFRTGDLGRRDEGGYLFLTGRARELIISGGLNVYPREVEEALLSCDGVLEAAVLGQPDADLGERVVAAIVTGERDVDVAALRSAVAARLAAFKVPKEIHVVDALPKNAMGKVQKPLLAERLRASGQAARS